MKGKRTCIRLFSVSGLICLLLALSPAAGSAEEAQDVRPSILSGTWYPGSPQELTAVVDNFLAKVRGAPLEGELKGLIVPHAGYRYSGQVAAHAYRLLLGRPFTRVILVGPSHRVPFRGFSVNLQAGYQTPLGTVPVDREFGRALIAPGGHGGWIKRAHEQEHSLEIQLPFLQRALGSFRIVPILMGDQDPRSSGALADLLARTVAPSGDTLLLASSDLSHFHGHERAKALDHEFIRHVRAFDPEALERALAAGACEACGGNPVVAVLRCSRALGADRSLILQYADSGDVTGDRSRVVGYVSAALIKGADKGPRPQ